MAVLATETRTPAGRRLPAAPEPTPQRPIVTRAETADCTCPDACERDHERD